MDIGKEFKNICGNVDVLLNLNQDRQELSSEDILGRR